MDSKLTVEGVTPSKLEGFFKEQNEPRYNITDEGIEVCPTGQNSKFTPVNDPIPTPQLIRKYSQGFSFDDIFKDEPKLYSTSAVAKMLSHPLVNGNKKLRKFLKECGVIVDEHIGAEYCDKGYFRVFYSVRAYGKLIVPSIKVTQKGIKFIENLVKHKLN